MPDGKAAAITGSFVIDDALGLSGTAPAIYHSPTFASLFVAIAPNNPGALGVGLHRDIIGPTASLFGHVAGLSPLFPACPPAFDPISVG
jgi:hypothetical protein